MKGESRQAYVLIKMWEKLVVRGDWVDEKRARLLMQAPPQLFPM